MSIAEKLQTIAENQEKVYEAGKKAEYDAFWDMYQNNGNRYSYVSAFGTGVQNSVYWGDYLYPKYDIKPSTGAKMFENFKTSDGSLIDLEERCKECGITIDTSGTSTMQQAFYCATGFSVIPEINLTKAVGSTYVSQLFYLATNIHTVRKIILGSSNVLSGGVFAYMSKLENIVIEGPIRMSSGNLSLSGSKLLTHDSLMSFINALYDYTEDGAGTTNKITLGADNIAKLTEEELSMITDKGWTYA